MVFGLYGRAKKSEGMWIAILLALIAGFGSVAIGGITGTKVLIDGAGTLTVITSLAVTHVAMSAFA